MEIYEFEKTELNSQEEMEKQARQYAEEQVQHMQVEMQQLMQAKSAQAAQMLSMRQEFEGIQLQAQRQHDAMKQEHAQLAATITQVTARVRQLVHSWLYQCYQYTTCLRSLAKAPLAHVVLSAPAFIAGHWWCGLPGLCSYALLHLLVTADASVLYPLTHFTAPPIAVFGLSAQMQLQEERNDVLDRLNLLDMQVTALRSNNNELLGALEAEQQRSAQLEAALAARDKVSRAAEHVDWREG